jgi:GNAT superfamily N-acetyltransferase
MEYEAPDYAEEGTCHFIAFLRNSEETDKLDLYGAFEEDGIKGVIGTRNQGRHIALFFVEGCRQKQGIGKQLFETIRNCADGEKITVHSSPYAREIYRRLGFSETGGEQIVDGIRFTPMQYRKQSG